MKLPIADLAFSICACPAWAQPAAQDEADPTAPQVAVAPQASSVLAVPFVQIPLPGAAPPPRVSSGLAQIIRAKYPLSIGFEDLGAGWREIAWQGPTYFTKGESVFIDDTEYLVTYRASSSSAVRDLNERNYVLYLTRRTNLLRPGARFPITLLKMNDVQDVITRGETGLKSFEVDAYKDTAAPPTSDAFNQNLSLLFLRKIGEAFAAYSSANLDVLPPLDNAIEARRNLEPFGENGAIFLQPGSRAPFRFNPILSGRKRAHLRGKGFFILAYEGDAAPDGSRAVLRLNGSVLRVSDKMWQKMKDASKLD